MGKKSSKFMHNDIGISLSSNNIEMIDQSNIYFRLLMNLALTRYKWEGFPSSIDTRFLELNLLLRGSVSFFYSESFGYLCLPYTSQNMMDYYSYPLSIQPYSNADYDFPVLDSEEFVIIYNDVMHTTPMLILSHYAEELTNIATTLRVNTRKLRNPMTALCDESKKLTYQKIFEKIQTGEIVLLGSKTIELEDFKPLPTYTDTDVKSIPELREYEKDVWYRALSYLGIRNMNTGKTERAIVDEVNAQNEETDIFKNVGLMARKSACKMINERFGLNVSVRYGTIQPETTTPGDDKERNGVYNHE